MTDQAARLREQLNMRHNQPKQAHTIAVTSGKGGVGKSNFSLNFSLALLKENHRVLLFDLDIGMGNIEILIGSSSQHTIVDFLEQQLSIADIITKGPSGLDYISGGTGLTNLFKLSESKFQHFASQLERVFHHYDYVIFDMGAGISEDALRFILSVDEIIAITTPEPTSLTDAYAAIKYICINNDSIPFSIVVNRSYDRKVGESTYQRLSLTIKQFLSRDIPLLGTIPDDPSIMKAVIHQTPFLLYQPNSQASKALINLTSDYLKSKSTSSSNIEQKAFITKLKSFFMKGR
ncbi:MinD/ParA family protein [Metabacillus herbersteinensis]